MVRAGEHIVAGWSIPTNVGSANSGAMILTADASWASESCANHPEPGSATFRLFVPAVLDGVFSLSLGARTRAELVTDGTSVCYFSGRADKITSVRAAPTPTPTWSARATTASNATNATAELTPRGTVRLESTAAATSLVSAYVTIPLTGTATSGTYLGNPVRVQVLTWAPSANGRTPIVGITGSDLTWSTFQSPSRVSTSGGIIVAQVGYYLDPGEAVEFLVCAVEQNRGRAAGRYYDVVSSDVLASAQRYNKQMMPVGYLDTAGTSRLALNIPEQFLGPNFWDFQLAAPLAATFEDCLNYFRRACINTGRMAIAQDGYIAKSPDIRPARNIVIQNGQATLVPVGNELVSVFPSSSVPDLPIVLDMARVITRISATYFVWKPALKQAANTNYVFWPSTADDLDQKTETVTSEFFTEYGSIERKFDTTIYLDEGSLSSEVGGIFYDRMRKIWAGQSSPRWYFDGDPEVIPRDLDSVERLDLLLDLGTRFGRPLRFSGTLPDRVPADHRQRGGRLSFTGGRWRYSALVEPIDYAGVDSIQFSTAATVAGWTIGASRNLTIADLGRIR